MISWSLASSPMRRPRRLRYWPLRVAAVCPKSRRPSPDGKGCSRHLRIGRKGGEGLPQRRALVGSPGTFSLNANIGAHLGCRASSCVAGRARRRERRCRAFLFRPDADKAARSTLGAGLFFITAHVDTGAPTDCTRREAMPISPVIEITYCRLCGWGLRAGWMAQELLTTFAEELGSVTLAPDRTGGVFEVRVDDEVIWSRKERGRFPELKEIKQLVRDRVAPGRSLGHTDAP